MTWTYRVLPLDGYRLGLLEPNELEVIEAEAQVDGEDWGRLKVATLQARLEAGGEFAIVQLEAGFRTRGRVPGGEIAVSAVGLRNLNLDGSYLTPLKAEAGAGLAGYAPPRGNVGDRALGQLFPVVPTTGNLYT